MGDYGFKGAGEFGGTSIGENFHCLPDYERARLPAKSLDTKIGECPLAAWKFWDAMVSADGDYECQSLTRPNEPGEFGGPGDRPNCDCANYSSCKWYQEGRLIK